VSGRYVILHEVESSTTMLICGFAGAGMVVCHSVAVTLWELLILRARSTICFTDGTTSQSRRVGRRSTDMSCDIWLCMQKPNVTAQAKHLDPSPPRLVQHAQKPRQLAKPVLHLK